jgi:hypothetical protein
VCVKKASVFQVSNVLFYKCKSVKARNRGSHVLTFATEVLGGTGSLACESGGAESWISY